MEAQQAARCHRKVPTMQTIDLSYTITVSDFRKATYYALFLRHRRALRIMFLVLGVAVAYGVAGAMGAGTVNYLVFFLALGYLIWGLLLFAGAEKGIKRYLTQSGRMLGCRYEVTINDHHIRFRIPEQKSDVSVALKRLACAYEISALFLLYINTQEVYLLPKRALTDEQCAAFRALLRVTLGERFASRFEKKQ